MAHVTFDHEPPASLTTLVMAFGGWIDAGRAATGALRHMLVDLSAGRVAWIESEDFFMFTQERPEVRLRPAEEEEALAARAGIPREELAPRPVDVAASIRPEPHLKWAAYAKAFLDVAERCGVKRIVSLGTLLAGTPHTRPVPVTGRCTDPVWRSLLEAWGIYRPPTYEGPTGISTIVLDAAERRGMSHLGFMGQAPHYLQDTENPAAIEALLGYVGRLLHLSLDTSRLAEPIREFRAECDKAVARNRSTREHVRQLEQEYDAAARQLDSGGEARVFNDRGAFVALVEVSLRVRPGVVASTKGRWPGRSKDNANVNATVDERDSDMGGGAVFHDNRVEVERV